MAKLIVLVSLILLVWAAPMIADTTYTVDIIEEGLLAAEAQFTDLRLDYVIKRGMYTVTEVIYAQKMLEGQKTPKRLRYMDRIVSVIDPNTKQSTLVRDTLSSFDGEATIILNRNIESDEPMKGYILVGYDPNHFPRGDIDPHSNIWYFDNKLLGDYLKEDGNTFRIESESEVLNGIPTVKLVGTIWGGVGTLKLWVSPQRDFLPIKVQVIRTSDGRLASEMVLSNLLQLPNGMWYPKTIRYGSREFPHICNILKISFDPIPQEFFSPEFPANTQVYDDILKISYKTY